MPQPTDAGVGVRSLPPTSPTSTAPRIVAPIVLAALVVSHFALFSRFFPNARGRLGDDYSYFLPNLFDGFCWFRTNGLASVPWFTPSFLGGTLGGFTNVQRDYFSVPQFLTFVFDPLTAVRATVLVMAAVGAAGGYVLLRRSFRLSRAASLVGAGLFLYNGFYGNRMAVGHLGYHAYMLTPLVAHVLLRPLPAETRARRRRFVVDAVAAAALFAAMAMSDLVTILPAVVLSVVAVGLIHGLAFGGTRAFWSRFAAASAGAVALAAARLASIVYFLANEPRTDYSIPGARNLLEAAGLAARCLFISPAWDPHRDADFRDVQWAFGREEWKYSVSLVALALLLLGLWRLGRRVLETGRRPRPRASVWVQTAALAALLALPIVLNTDGDAVERAVKSVPLLNNSSTMLRWFVLYVLPATVAAALAFDATPALTRRPAAACASLLLALVVLKYSIDRTYYEEQSYDPRPIVDAYREMKRDGRAPEIKAVGLLVDEHGRPDAPMNRNDLVASGLSQMIAYDATFGYDLENLPLESLHPGPCLESNGGVLNVKNPAYYLWPRVNGGRPGDHFTVAQRKAAEAFLHYRPFPFRMPALQRAANWINVAAAAAAAGLLCAHLARLAASRLRGRPREASR